ncbi:TPA: hypothetical protein KAL10_004736 [Escherichia coli]|nr:hypothetical protein [Escherichia coli]HBA3749300.1 hypothetical protein [Escherichia coli]HBA3811688.1 hypothetical protein [Escherichia coli]HBA3875204.1 hypothetical protein [Escherichia coli]HBA4038220.1 hypothetical protein [Escherichia coli]
MTIYWWLTTFRAAGKPECRPLGRHILDYPILFKVTQKTTPATFIEWRNMFDIKMTWLISPNSDKYKQIPLNIKNTNR